MKTDHLWCFDLDGPILDVSERYYRLYRDLISEFGGRPASKSTYWEQKRDSVSEMTIFRATGLEPGLYESYRQLRIERIERLDYLSYDRGQPYIESILRKRANRKLVLVTLRRSAENLKVQLRELRLNSLFDHLLCAEANSAVEERVKIKVKLVQNIFSAEMISGWMVGDTETDVLTGKHLGLRTVAVTYGIRTERRLKASSPDRLLSSPEELHAWAESETKGLSAE